MNIRLSQIGKRISRYSWWIMAGICFLYAVLFVSLSILNHIGLRSQLRDLGHMQQALWQLTRGNWLMPLSDPQLGLSRLAQHRNLIFYLIAPFFALHPQPVTLSLFGSLSVSLAGFLIFCLARKVLENDLIALVFGTVFLASPLVQSANVFDFHPILLGLPLFIGAVLAMEYRRWLLYWLAVLLLLTVKEDMALLVFCLGIFVGVRSSPRQGLFTVAAGVAYWFVNWYLFSSLLSIPPIKPPWHRFAYLGKTPGEAFINLFLRPGLVVNQLLRPIPFQYLLFLILQGGFLALWSPAAALMAAPNTAQNLLDHTNWQCRISIGYYSAIVMVTMLTASIYGLRRLRLWNARLALWLLGVFCLQALVFTMMLSPAPYGLTSEWADFGIYHSREDFDEIKALIPADAALATQNNLGPHFASREIVVEYPKYIKHADYVLIHIQDPSYYDNGLFARSPEPALGVSDRKIKKHFSPLFFKKEFGVLRYIPPFYLFKRGEPHTLNKVAYKHFLRDVRRFEADRRLDRREYLRFLSASWLPLPWL